MSTEKQIAANRRNAQKSTGPKTPQGKAAVSMNSLRHGLRARTVVLPGDDPQEFQRLCEDLEAEWQPLTRTEQIYLEQMATAYWKLQRLELFEKRTLSERSDLAPLLLERVWQAQQRLERSFARAQHELERIQIYRGNQPAEPASPVEATATHSASNPARTDAASAQSLPCPPAVPVRAGFSPLISEPNSTPAPHPL